MAELHPQMAEALAFLPPAQTKSRDAIATYQEMFSPPNFSMQRTCPQCFAPVVGVGMRLSPAALRLWNCDPTATTLWCDEDCLREWLEDRLVDVVTREGVHLRQSFEGDWEVPV